MTTDTETLIAAKDLLPGDFLNLEGDKYVDVPDHCMTCGGPAGWFPATDAWTHTDDTGSDDDHEVIEVPRDVSLDYEGKLVWRVITPENFDAVALLAFGLISENDRPADGTCIVLTTDDDWIVLPNDHEVKVIERRGAEAVED